MLVDRAAGSVLGVTLFETEDALRRADEATNAGAGHGGTRTDVQFYEVPIHVL